MSNSLNDRHRSRSRIDVALIAVFVGCALWCAYDKGPLPLCAMTLLLILLAYHFMQGRHGLSQPAKHVTRPAREDAPKTLAHAPVKPGATAPKHASRHATASQVKQPAPSVIEGDVTTEKESAQGDIVVHSHTASPVPQHRSALDFAELSRTLERSDDPIADLKLFVGDIRTREANAASAPGEAPSGLERYAARQLDEAGLFSSDVVLPTIEVVRPDASRMVYLRVLDTEMPYLARLRIIRLEAALNAIRFAAASLDAQATCEEAYRLNQGLARSIAAQKPSFDPSADPAASAPAGGEWAVRFGISQAIESFQLPYRLTARYRTNVSDGNVAIEFDYMPAEVFPASCYVEGLGIVASSGDLRQQAAADYALRLALLLAASAFACSERIKHVWVAAVHENATRRTCYLSVDFDRWRFNRLDLAHIDDLSETYRLFAPMMRYEDGWLRPVKQGFHLEEERFCPSRRYVPVSLSSRRLEGSAASSLGCDHVSGLAIEEADNRALVASTIMMNLAPESDAHATQHNVRTILELAGDDPDPTVRSAAERVVKRLLDGTLSPDAFAIGEEFVRGDSLTRANDRAKDHLMHQNPQAAHAVIESVLERIDRAGLYDDTPHVIYRYFNSFIERALFNRTHVASHATSTVLLAPDSYYEAHLLASVTSLATGDVDDALRHAERLRILAPFDARSRLHLVACLDAAQRDEEAVDCLTELLKLAHDPLGVGFAYYRMAYFQWKQGNVTAAQACYHQAMQLVPMAVPMMAMELGVLHMQHGSELLPDITTEKAEDVLVAQGIPVAPTQETSDAFYECAQASLDAEIFPVARNFAHVLGAFPNDDIITGLIRSLEDAPDHG